MRTAPPNRLSGIAHPKWTCCSDDELPRIRAWESAGWAVIDESPGAIRVRLTPTGWLRLDSLAADLAVQRSRTAIPV